MSHAQLFEERVEVMERRARARALQSQLRARRLEQINYELSQLLDDEGLEADDPVDLRHGTTGDHGSVIAPAPLAPTPETAVPTTAPTLDDSPAWITLE